MISGNVHGMPIMERFGLERTTHGKILVIPLQVLLVQVLLALHSVLQLMLVVDGGQQQAMRQVMFTRHVLQKQSGAIVLLQDLRLYVQKTCQSQQ